MNPCPHCADSGFVRAPDGGLDACPRCARIAEAEFAFAALTCRPAPRPSPLRHAARPARRQHATPERTAA